MIDKENLYEQIKVLQQILDNQDNVYDYEKAFDEKWQEITRSVFQSSLGETPKGKNQKKA